MPENTEPAADPKKPAAAKKEAAPEAQPLFELPVELLDAWAVSPFAWAKATDASEAWQRYRADHPDAV